MGDGKFEAFIFKRRKTSLMHQPQEVSLSGLRHHSLLQIAGDLYSIKKVQT